MKLPRPFQLVGVRVRKKKKRGSHQPNESHIVQRNKSPTVETKGRRGAAEGN